jgi:hypothetical protein
MAAVASGQTRNQFCAAYTDPVTPCSQSILSKNVRAGCGCTCAHARVLDAFCAALRGGTRGA